MSDISRHLYNAIKDYGMISPGEKIAVGLSGGKDSLSLLSLLAPLRKRLEIELEAYHIIPWKNYTPEIPEKLSDYCGSLEIPFFVKKTDILDYIEKLGLKKDICFLCAHMRRKELFLMMEARKVSKIAFGHHRNDAIETFLMNILYSAQTCTMMPVQSLFNGKITVVRPMYTLSSSQIEKWSRKNGLPVVKYECPKSGKSKRDRIRSVISELSKENRRIEWNIFKSMHNVNTDYLPREKVTGSKNQL